MRPVSRFAVLTLVLPLVGLTAQAARAEEVPAEYRETVRKGLDWLAREQNKDGRWEEKGGQYRVTMTALSGMALLMEGSTLRAGKYRDNLRRAADWLMDQAQPDGQLGTPDLPGEAGRYMHAHGYALLFLSCVYGEEEDGERRKKLADVLTRAVKFTREAQALRRSTRFKDKNGKPLKLGGWGYIAATWLNNFDEGPCSITQIQSLHAARLAGIEVPREALEEADNYLREATNEKGGLLYSVAQGGGDGRPAITAGALACAFTAEDRDSPRVNTWLSFCQEEIQPLTLESHQANDDYAHYYYAQVVFGLGEEGYGKLFPKSKEDERLTWSRYRKATFAVYKAQQDFDGSWRNGPVGPVYTTAVHLCVMQLDNAALPIYRR
jgi:hypothetical protein